MASANGQSIAGLGKDAFDQEYLARSLHKQKLGRRINGANRNRNDRCQVEACSNLAGSPKQFAMRAEAGSSANSLVITNKTSNDTGIFYRANHH
ncbi:hypothetical protein SFSGTM_29610 [Sulfuriferula nivalis]|uniref:Uncharacterized protein n=1 Tax=Sulfuriferula nivalis TaxID=2675298 RepID=A0A809SAV0_9PROT|nr:hypothetical protein SFSGTM_29610 [Sulfuriferula nivalis]